MGSNAVERKVIGGMCILAAAALMGLCGCGDGGGAMAQSSGTSSDTAVTQSAIVLPSSVQVVTAK